MRSAKSLPLLTCFPSAVSVGFTLALVDLTYASARQGVSFSSPAGFVLPFAVTFTLIFLLYCILWIAVAAPASHWLPLEKRPVKGAMATLFATAFPLHLVFWNHEHLWFSNFGWGVLFCSVSMASIPLGYWVTAQIERSQRASSFEATLTAATPFLALEALGFVWLVKGPLSQRPDVFTAMASVLFGLILSSTCWVFHRFKFSRRMRFSLLAFSGVGICLSIVLSSQSAFPSSVTSPPSHGPRPAIGQILLLTVDTLRRDAAYAPGSAGGTTHVNRLAADGVVFQQAYSTSPWTPPSVASILTGTLPWVHGVTDPIGIIPPSLPTLFEVLSEAGYLTAAIGYNDLLERNRSMARGFDQYVFYPKRNIPRSFGMRTILEQFPSAFGAFRSTEDLTTMAVHWIRNHHQRRFFLWLHYYDPHGPYKPPAEYLPHPIPVPEIGPSIWPRGHRRPNGKSSAHRYTAGQLRWIRTLYDLEVRYVDDSLGRLISLLKELDLYEDLLIIFTSDHGEEFSEHGGLSHGHSLYTELLSVPLIIKLPGSETIRSVAAPVSNLRVMPTVLDLVGLPFDEGRFSAGSLRPAWGGQAEAGNGQPVVGTSLSTRKDREAVLFGSYKYIRSRDVNQEELFDVTLDPDERYSIAETMPKVVLQARRLLAQDRDRSGELRTIYGIQSGAAAPRTAEEKRLLRSLGYVVD